MQRSERAKALEEAIKNLEAARVDPSLTGELDFEDARVDGLVTTALSAARAARAASTNHDDLASNTP